MNKGHNMNKGHTMITLNTECFTVQGDKIVKGTLKDFERFIEITPTPRGIESKYFVKRGVVRRFADEMGGTYLDFNTDSCESDADIAWALLQWQHGSENILWTFNTEREALEKLEQCHAYDIMCNDEFFIHLNRESAEQELDELFIHLNRESAEQELAAVIGKDYI